MDKKRFNYFLLGGMFGGIAGTQIASLVTKTGTPAWVVIILCVVGYFSNLILGRPE